MQNPFGNQNNNQDFLKNLPTPPNYAKVTNDTGDIRIAKVGGCTSNGSLIKGGAPLIKRRGSC